MSESVRVLVSEVRRYVEWVETGVSIDVRSARRRIANLYAAAVNSEALEQHALSWTDASDVHLKAWQTVFRRYGGLPGRPYSMVFDPLAQPAEPPVEGDLAVDIADIYGDVRVGLRLFDEGNELGTC